MSKTTRHTFESPEHLHTWLQANHASETELWVRIYKMGTGLPSVRWDDCVVAAICWGWIDGQRKSLDETSFLQRLTPRHAQAAAAVHHLLPAHQRQAPGNTAEAHGGDVGEVGAGRESLRVVAAE